MQSQVLAALMKKQKLKYECAVNGLEALTMYKAAHTSVDVIIMDMSMPVVSLTNPPIKVTTLTATIDGRL